MAFIDQGEFEAMKTLSRWEAARCDEHPFRAKIKKNGTFATAHFFVKLSSAWLLVTYMSLADHKGTQRGSLDA